jgi:pyruvate dehydrogenase E2 component (dihydrolipoamide acetyltransferase)
MASGRPWSSEMTVHDFRLPDVGEGVAEGEVVEWLVEPGETVTEDQPVAEVETDKAVVDVPSPYDGRVVELHWEVGDLVPVGDVLLTFETDDDATLEDESEGVEQTSTVSEDATETVDQEPASESSDGRVFAPPHVRRRARELGVDISTVEGSGPSGRVTEADVEAAASSDEEAEESVPRDAVRRVDEDEATGTVERASAPESVDAAGREKTLAVPATRRVAREEGVDINDVPAVEERDDGAFVTAEAVKSYAAAQQGAQAADRAAVGGEGAPEGEPATIEVEAEDERVPYRGIRRTIGEQMERSKFTAPHVSHHDSVVVQRLAEWRADMKERAAEQDVRLTYMPFIMKAVVAALEDFPYLNSQLDEEAGEIVLRGEYNIGVAVATDAGLMVPVVEDVDKKGILDLAAETQSLAARARDRDLAREEMQGSTFTLTNFGAIGGEYATPIINYPEVAILGLGAIEQRPVVEDDAVVARKTLPLSLSIDHRVVDGAVAAEFVNTVKEYLADPRLLLLE